VWCWCQFAVTKLLLDVRVLSQTLSSSSRTCCQPPSCRIGSIHTPVIRTSSTWRWTARSFWRKRRRTTPRRHVGCPTPSSATSGPTFSRPKETTSSCLPKPARLVDLITYITRSIHLHAYTQYTPCRIKGATIFLPLTLPNTDRLL